jgi:hypothetical protein
MGVDHGPRAAGKGIRALVFLLFALGLAACNRSPGPLEGVWRSDGALPMKIAFRPGETETMGIIEPVEYKVNGSVVTITYTGGLMKGSSMRFAMLDANRATSPLFNLKRVK